MRGVTAGQKTVENKDWAAAGRRAVSGRGPRPAFSKTLNKELIKYHHVDFIF